ASPSAAPRLARPHALRLRASASARSGGGILRHRQLFQAFAEQNVIPVLAIERAALEQPLVHRRRQPVLDAALRDAEVIADQAAQRLAQQPLALAIAVAQPVRQLGGELDVGVVEIGVADLERIPHRQPVRHDEQRLQKDDRLEQAQVLRQRVVLAPLRREVVEQQRDPFESAPARHAAEALEIAAEVAPAQRSVRAAQIFLDAFLLAQQDLVAEVAGEELVGALAGQRDDKAVAARLAGETEERKHAETADRKLDAARQVGERFEELFARRRDDARLEPETLGELADVLPLVDRVLELGELYSVPDLTLHDRLDEGRIDAAGQEDGHRNIGDLAQPARVLQQIEQLTGRPLFVVDRLLELRKTPPAAVLQPMVGGRIDEVLARPHAVHAAERRVFVEVELERLADRDFLQLQVADDLEL